MRPALQILSNTSSVGIVAAYRFAYDSDNRLTQFSSFADNLRTNYTYDRVDQLTGTSTSIITGMVAPFIPTNEAHSYDATGNGQEAMRWVDSDGSGTGQILRLTNRYLWADSVDQLLSDEQYWNNTGMAINATTSSTVAGNTLWTLGDHLGSIRDLLDNNGVIREHQVFDSYGRLVREVDYTSAGQVIASNDASAVDTVFGYTGRSWDTDVNLQYNRARWYDPQTGRWLSQDPIGFAAGDANLYRYVGNDVTNATDPTGLMPNRKDVLKLQDVLQHIRWLESQNPGFTPKQILDLWHNQACWSFSKDLPFGKELGLVDGKPDMQLPWVYVYTVDEGWIVTEPQVL
ncbi:MAG: RHS repeat-associated core domain-containing protein [Pirellula sp.]